MHFYCSGYDNLNISNFKYLDEGQVGKIYVDGDTAFKVYNCYSAYSERLGRKMFKSLKKLNLPNIVNLHDYYYENPILFAFFHAFDAYTMDYIKGNTNIIDFDINNLIEILKSLEHTISLLTDNRIILYDVHKKNIIVNENGITIIDPDKFYFSKFLSKKNIYRLNKLELLNCINSKILSEISNSKEDIKSSLFDVDDGLSFFQSTSKCINSDQYQKILRLK